MIRRILARERKNNLIGSKGEIGSIDLGVGINDIALTSDSSLALVTTGTSVLKIVNLQSAALNIKASDTNITAYLNGDAPKVLIQSISAQSSVTYTIESGVLPAGLALTVAGNTTAIISGEPLEIGTFNVTVKGTNAKGEEKLLQIQYIVDNIQPPILGDLKLHNKYLSIKWGFC